MAEQAAEHYFPTTNYSSDMNSGVPHDHHNTRINTTLNIYDIRLYKNEYENQPYTHRMLVGMF